MRRHHFLAAAVLSVFLTAPVAKALHIVIDPGHGGTDNGAVYGKTKESDLVLVVSQKLKNLLEKDASFQVSITRSSDIGLSLPARVKFAEDKKADLFVSLHANAAMDPRARGVEFFFQNSLPPDEESLFLASRENQISVDSADLYQISGGDDLSRAGDIAAIIEDLKRQHRMHESLRFSYTLSSSWNESPRSTSVTIKQAPFYVISKTSMPAVLVEIGFLSNPHELRQLTNNQYQQDIAQKIYSALVSYKEKIDKHTTQTLN